MAYFFESGGLAYHTKAFRYRSKLWLPFRRGLSVFIRNWLDSLVSKKSITLIGASAGHCLPFSLFVPFETVTVIDPDPVARFIFQARLRSASHALGVRAPRLDWRNQLMLPQDLVAKSQFSASEDPILFCNFIGQLSLSVPEELTLWRLALPKFLQNRPWMSFHDRLSGDILPQILPELTEQQMRLTDQEILHKFYRYNGKKVQELNDHLTDGFFPARAPHSYLTWELYPGRYHLIEVVAQAQSRKSTARPLHTDASP